MTSNNKPAKLYSFYDKTARKSIRVENIKDIPTNTVAFGLCKMENGNYCSIGECFIYNGYNYTERHEEYAVEVSRDDWRWFKTEAAAHKFINTLSAR